MTYQRQLALPFSQPANYDAAGFIAAPANAEALAWLARPIGWPDMRLALYGPEGSGKTHLLHTFAARHGAMLLPGETMRPLYALPEAGGLAVDDADCAPEPETLLHLLNAAAQQNLPVLLAGRAPPAHWPVALPDLASRLRATASVEMAQPDDELLRALFAQLLAQLQLRVPSSVQEFLLTRLPRHGGALREAAACLNRASLASGRAVGRALADDVLARMGALGPDAKEPDLPQAGGLL